MTEPLAASPNRPQQAPDPKRKGARAGALPLLESLERLREQVRRHLDRLEEAARERAAELDAALSRERELTRRVAELEASGARAEDDDEERERQWREALEQLEGDRRLLAEAWERLEREQVAGRAGGHPVHIPPPAPHPPRPASADRPVGQPASRPQPAFEMNDPVTQAVLRQFQALRGDVRRSAQERCLD